ncbi:MAG TPA: tRNA (adenosine(37)-N6)-threonylcarbamoyltransferase complex dimerization subunit type 1 TsaB [Chthonomonadales bacterium]|nr:tRNA (adenosine(37)-N6)-threonylcarbamoyltransferase complex dimerization subunit type 1 TsaB [Chthonomonadales bacterium]
MKVLGIETTGEVCGVAVTDESGLLVERRYRHRMRLVERLVADVDAALADAGLALGDLDGIGAGIGPGSLTGVRIGVMTAKTLAAAVGLPAVGIGATVAIASDQAAAPEERVVAIVRARPGSVYADLDASPSPPRLMVVGDLVGELARPPVRPVVLCGEGCVRDGATIAGALAAAGVAARIGSVEGPRPSTVARLAMERLLAGERPDAIALAPLYVAPPPIDPRAERFAPR